MSQDVGNLVVDDEVFRVIQSKRHLPQIVNEPERPKNLDGRREKNRELFNHFSLAMDKETAKYMPYDNVAFPKLVDNADNSVCGSKSVAELEAMWMVGFIDHEKRSENKLAVSDLSHFISLPGGQIPPGAATQIRKIYKKDPNRPTSAERKLKKLTANQRRRIMGRAKVAANLSDEHILRLKELTRTKGGAVEDFSRRTKLKRQRRRRALPHAVYGAENKKIRRAIRDKNPSKATAVIVRSRALDHLFDTEREHHQAVLCIQRSYKSYKLRLYWRDIVRRSRAVKVIQRYARGMITRTLVRVWLLRRSWLVVVAQAHVRGRISRKRTRRRTRVEIESIVLIQRIVRGYLGRLRADSTLSFCSATKIQAMWRGCAARTTSDKGWLDREVILIQKIARGFLARSLMHQLYNEHSEAAWLLQRVYRGVRGRWQCSDMLWERETQRRRDFLRILRAEDDWHCEELSRMKQRLEKVYRFDQSREFAKKQYTEMEDTVQEKEFDYLSMVHERAQVDTLAVTQGWAEALDSYIVQQRRKITHAKFEFLFVGAMYKRHIDNEFCRVSKEISDMEIKIREIQRLRQEEAEKLYERESTRKWEIKRRLRRRCVAQQRRRWQVTFYTRDGKVDKKRRKGYAWDPSVYSGAEKEVFNVGSVNLLVGGDTGKNMNGLELISQQVALQNAQNQFVQHGALLKPLFDGMENLTDGVVRMSLRNSAAKHALEQIEQEEEFIQEID